MRSSLIITHSIEDLSLDRVGGYLLGLDFVFPLITLALTVHLTNDELPILMPLYLGRTHFFDSKRTYCARTVGPDPMTKYDSFKVKHRTSNQQIEHDLSHIDSTGYER